MRGALTSTRFLQHSRSGGASFKNMVKEFSPQKQEQNGKLKKYFFFFSITPLKGAHPILLVLRTNPSRCAAWLPRPGRELQRLLVRTVSRPPCFASPHWLGESLLFTPRKGYSDNVITRKNEEAPFFYAPLRAIKHQSVHAEPTCKNRLKAVWEEGGKKPWRLVHNSLGKSIAVSA